MKFDNNSSRFLKNWQIKILCFIFAVFIYAFVAFEADGERVVSMPLEIKMPEGYVPTSIVPEYASVVIKGSEKQIYLLDVSKVKLYADFSDVHDRGVASASVNADYSAIKEYVNLSEITILTKPSIVRIFFE